ncbi:MAG: EAL domain-containing protein [Prochlorotrichaceae cyanobacterium]
MKTILVIEDDTAIRNNIAMILKSQGFTILQAEDGLTGVELALGSAPDLIVCDIMLPQISGYEILEQLRQEANLAVTPFIFLTALADRADMRQGMNLGADDYLTKPFTSQELIGAVNARLLKQQELTEPYRNEMRKAAENLRQMAYTDLLTNLPNRVLFWQKIEEYLAQPQKSPSALILVRLLNLNEIIEQQGQSIADLLIQSLARSLQAMIEEEDLLARCQIDSFGIFLTHQAESDPAIEAWLQPLITDWIPAYPIGNQLINCDLKIAIAPYPLAGQSTPELISAAEKVLGSFGEQTTKPYLFYTEALQQTFKQTERIHVALEQALAQDQLEIYYQPILNTITGRIIGLEALLGWKNSEFQHLTPFELWQVAQQSNQILSIDQWKLNTVLSEFKALQKYSLSPLKITISLSNAYLQQPDFVEMLQGTLQQFELDFSALTIEIQEIDLLQFVEQYSGVLETLSGLGVQFALNHFGTGYSSLTHLSQLPLHYLKVDPEIVTTLSQNSQSESILKAIINLAQSLKLKVIAAGVVTEDQLNIIRKQGCPLMQGDLYNPPVPAAEVQSLLDNDRRLN